MSQISNDSYNWVVHLSEEEKIGKTFFLYIYSSGINQTNTNTSLYKKYLYMIIDR